MSTFSRIAAMSLSLLSLAPLGANATVALTPSHPDSPISISSSATLISYGYSYADMYQFADYYLTYIMPYYHPIPYDRGGWLPFDPQDRKILARIVQVVGNRTTRDEIAAAFFEFQRAVPTTPTTISHPTAIERDLLELNIDPIMPGADVVFAAFPRLYQNISNQVDMRYLTVWEQLKSLIGPDEVRDRWLDTAYSIIGRVRPSRQR